MNLRLSLRRRYSAFLGVYLDERPPILVYQMGKVGSSSVRNSLLLHGVSPVLHFHSFFPVRNWSAEDAPVDDAHRDDLRKEIEQERRAYREAPLLQRLNVRYREWAYNKRVFDRYVRGDRRADVVTLVRDPIAANISMFFQLFREYTGARYVPGKFSTAKLVEVFRNEYPHARPLTWLDAELRAHLGIDVFETPFPKERGHATIEKRNFRLLLLKCEIPDEAKRMALEEFLDLEGLAMVRSNVGEQKAYAEQYREFRQRMVFPDEFLDDMYGSRYARHFYDESEIAGFRAKWAERAPLA